MRNWKFFDQEKPSHGKPMHLLLEVEATYPEPTGKVLGAYVEMAVLLKNGMYIAIAPPDIWPLPTEYHWIAWRYYPEELIDAELNSMVIKAVGEYDEV